MEFILRLLGVRIKRVIPRPSILFIKGKNISKSELMGVEIGVYGGENVKSILKILPIKKIYLIDPYEKYENYKEDALNNVEQKAHKKLIKYKEKIIWIKKRSIDALKDIPNELDFVYIDGNHSYNFVKKDMKEYYKKLKIGGVLAGHDIENGIELNDGVTRAFVEFVSENHLKPYILYPDWWIVKGEKIINKK